MKTRLFLLALLVVCSQSAFAWGPRGHRVVGLIAEKRLAAVAPDVLTRAHTLLQSSNAPTVKRPDGTFPPDCQPIDPPRSFAEVANLPDDFRQIELALVTRDWHFVNIDINNPAYKEARDCANGDCVVRRIERMREILKDRGKGPCDQESALIYLVHFIGDLHQPMHTGFGHTADGKPDQGGNLVRVTIDGVERKLHGVWDSSIIERQNRTDEEWVNHLMTDVLGDRDPAALAAGTVVDWTNASHKLAIKRHVKDKTTLSDEYIKDATKDVDEQLLRAGLRLARLIEEALK